MDPLKDIQNAFLFAVIALALLILGVSITMPMMDAKYSTAETISGTLVAVQQYQDEDSACKKPECWKYQIALKQANGEVRFFDATSSQVYQFDLKVGMCVKVDFIDHYVRSSDTLTDVQPCGE